MRTAIHQRLELIREMVGRPSFKIIAVIWTVIGLWDTTISQLIPEELGKDAPRVYQIATHILKTSRRISLEGWLLAGAFLLIICTLEFAFRTTRTERIRQRYIQPSTSPEKGFLDFQVDAREAMDDMSKAINLSNKDMIRFSRGIDVFGNRIKYIKSAKWRRRYASRVARYINSYSNRLRRTSDFIGAVMPVILESQAGIIRQETNINFLNGFSVAMNELTETVLPTTIESMRGLRQSTTSIRGISADLNAASITLDDALSSYIEKTETFQNYCMQLHAIAAAQIQLIAGLPLHEPSAYRI